VASYVLIGSISIVQVLSPKVSEEVVAATIKTVPTGIVATTLVPQAAFDDGTGAQQLSDFADAIEAQITAGKAVAATGTDSLDASGLQQYYVVFEVAYQPPGAPQGTVTADVSVPVALLTSATPFAGGTRRMNASDLIDKTYNSLVALSGGASVDASPAPAPGIVPTVAASGG
jgi:hypothetical protein